MNPIESLDNYTKEFTLKDGNTVKFQWASSGLTAHVKDQNGKIAQIASENIPKGLRKISSEAEFHSYLSGVSICVKPSGGQLYLNIQQSQEQKRLICNHHKNCADDLLASYRLSKDGQECTSSTSSSSLSTSNRRELLTEFRRHVKKIDRWTFSTSKKKTTVANYFGQKLRALLLRYEQTGKFDKHYDLLQVYLECILKEGCVEQLNEAQDLIDCLIEKSASPDKTPFLQCYRDLIAVSNFLLSIETNKGLTLRVPNSFFSEIMKHQPLFPIDQLFDMQEIEKFQAKTVLIAFTSIYWTTYFIRERNKNPLPLIEHYPPDYQTFLGKLFLTALKEEFPPFRDIQRTYPNFFSAALSNPENHTEEISQLWSLFKGENSTTKATILEEMTVSVPFNTLIYRFEGMTQLRSYRPADPLLPFSEYFLQESTHSNQENVHSKWIGHVGGKGYFITHRDRNWCYLCNTEEGEMLEPGPLLNAEVLFSTSDRIYLKILKKDGWHLFNTETGIEDNAFDQIWFVGKIDQEGYLAVKKEKAITICDLMLNSIYRTFPLAIFIDLLAERSFIVAVKFADHCEIWNLKQNERIVPDLNLHQVNKISKTDRFVKCRDQNNTQYLLDLEHSLAINNPEMNSICFAVHDDVFGRDSINNPWVFTNGRFLPIRKTYQQEVINYFQASLTRSTGITSYGVSFSPSKTVRHTLTIESHGQGSYNIIIEANSQNLWIDSTASKKRSDKGSFDVITTEGQIQLLGVSQNFYRGEKGYFSIVEADKRYLYVSPYGELKEAIDKNRPKKPEGIKIELPVDCNDVHYIHGQFLKINIAGKWHLYQENNGTGTLSDIGYDDITHLDGVNFIKAKRRGHWFLYDLGLNFELDEPATDIQLCSGSHRIALVSNHAVRYIDCNILPKEIAPLRSDVSLQGVDPLFRNNFLLNLREQRPTIQNPDLPLPVFLFLTMLTEHCLLRKISATFLIKLIDHLNDYEVKSQENWEIEISELNITIATLNTQIRPLRIVKSSSNRDKIRTLRDQVKSLKVQLEHVKKMASYALQWPLSKETFSQHPHLWNGLLRYWMQLDPEGNSLPQFFEKLYHLTDLISRLSEHCTNEFPDINRFQTINKHYIQIIKLYSFHPEIVNNYIIANSNDELIQEVFLTLGALTGKSKELEFFHKALEIGPKTIKRYEEIEIPNREAFIGQLNQYIRLLILIAISNQLRVNEIINEIDLKPFQSGTLDKLTQAIASSIRMSFYRQTGILTEAHEEMGEIPETYLVHLMYADSMMDKNNRTLLKILLKCAVRQLDFNAITEDETVLDSNLDCFTTKEKVILKNISESVRETRNIFAHHNIYWEIWQQGVGEHESDHFKVRIWERSPIRDLFQGEYCGSCISMSKGNAKAALSYIVNKNFSMIEIINKQTNQTIGHVTIWMAIDNDNPNSVMLVMNSFQVHRTYVESNKKYQESQISAFCKEILHLVFDFVSAFAHELGSSRLILGRELIAEPFWRLLDDVINPVTEIQDEETDGLSELESDSDSESTDGENLTTTNEPIGSLKSEQYVHPRIIGPVFGGSFYSDLFFDFSGIDSGWVTPETTTAVSVYDIGIWLRLSRAESGLTTSAAARPTISSSSPSSSI